MCGAKDLLFLRPVLPNGSIAEYVDYPWKTSITTTCH